MIRISFILLRLLIDVVDEATSESESHRIKPIFSLVFD